MNALNYLTPLVAYPSVSNTSNAEVSEEVTRMLTKLNFDVERIEYKDASNVLKVSLVAKRGTGLGGLAYFSHTDVVPPGDWYGPQKGPWVLTQKGDRVYGRGSCDMKGSLACMLAAIEQFGERPLSAPIYFIATADEEIGFGGASAIVERSKYFREIVEGQSHSIIGEPTLLEVVYAHKGVAGFEAISRGRAAHSSSREGVNANLAMIPFLQEMKQIYEETERDSRWQNDEFDPPTVTWNIGINDHTPAVNITPPQSVCTVYFRPMPGTDLDELLDRVEKLAEQHGLEYREKIRGKAVYTQPDSEFVQQMLTLTGQQTAKTVAYGTDGSMFEELNRMVVCGPGGIAQAHTHDEWIALEQLEKGTATYLNLVEHFCGK